jgi:hypothetical protein
MNAIPTLDPKRSTYSAIRALQRGVTNLRKLSLIVLVRVARC